MTTTNKFASTTIDNDDDINKTTVTASPVSVAIIPSVVPPPLMETTWSTIEASQKSQRTVNPIRAIVDPILANLAADCNNNNKNGNKKPFISLALGDPTATPNFVPMPAAIAAVQSQASQSCSYVNACGTTAARQAIADFHSNNTTAVVRPDDVIIANGCSGALELALTAILNPGDVLLIPQPGFALYNVICESHGARVVPYKLLPDQNWECDLQHLSELVTAHVRPRAILINNPGNPTGSVFSWRHLQDLVNFCDEHCLPIVADEIYGDLVYNNNNNNNNNDDDIVKFYPMAQVCASMGRRVPVITSSGLGKQFLLPGWRVGWLVFHDNMFGSFANVRTGVIKLAQVILGASHLAQAAVPAILADTPANRAWRQSARQTLSLQATALYNALHHIPGLTVTAAHGAMYIMVLFDVTKFDDIKNDLDFCKELLQAENVMVLPGSCFGIDNAFRLVFSAPVAVLVEAAERIRRFCAARYKSTTSLSLLDSRIEG